MDKDDMEQKVFIFHSNGAQFSGGVFSNRENAEVWISKHKLSGMLTGYPLDTGVYDWAVGCELFTPKKESQRSSSFIGSFSSAHLEHYHYKDGIST